jgi:hypothetical protein
MAALRTVLTRSRLLVILICGALFSVAVFFLDPSLRVGPFGLGLPASWTRLEVTNAALCIPYPDSWVGAQTPQGNHGDPAVVGAIGVPGRRWPQILVIRGPDELILSGLVAWAEERAGGHPGYFRLEPAAAPPSRWDGQVSEYTFSASESLGTTQVRCYDFSLIAPLGGYVLNMCAESADWQVVEPVFREVIGTLGQTGSNGAGCEE